MKITFFAVITALAIPLSAQAQYIEPISEFFMNGSPGAWAHYRTYDSGSYHVEIQRRYRSIGTTVVGAEFRARSTNEQNTCMWIEAGERTNAGVVLERNGRVPISANGNWASVGLVYPADQYEDSYGALNNSEWSWRFVIALRSHC